MGQLKSYVPPPSSLCPSLNLPKDCLSYSGQLSVDSIIWKRFSLLPVSGDRGNKYPTIVLGMVAFIGILSNMIWRALLSYPGIVGLTRKFPRCLDQLRKGRDLWQWVSQPWFCHTDCSHQPYRTDTHREGAYFLVGHFGFLSDPVTCWFWDFNYISQLSFLSCHMHTSHKSCQLACQTSPTFHHSGPCIPVSSGPHSSFSEGNTDCFCSSHPAAMNPDVNQQHARFWEPSLLKHLQDAAAISSWLFISARDVPSAQNVCSDVL